MIYLDNASTTKMSPRVVKKMTEIMEDSYGNPSAIYEFGLENNLKVEEARKTIAKLLGAQKHEIYFTSGGTESDNWALIGIAERYQFKGKHIITSRIEHKAILNTCKYLEEKGYEVTYLDVNSEGLIDLDELWKSIRNDTILVSIMYANNEVGTIMPIEKIAKICKDRKVLFHTDAVQAFGHMKIDTKHVPISMLSASGHKFYGPKGIGFLYVRSEVEIGPFIRGGKQENGLRSGTENVVSIVGMEEAAQECYKNLEIDNKRICLLRDYFINELLRQVDGIKINTNVKKSLFNNINITIDGVDGILLVDSLGKEGICVSTGASCNSDSIHPSYVLMSMGVSASNAKTSVRITLSKYTTKQELDKALEIIPKLVSNLREVY